MEQREQHVRTVALVVNAGSRRGDTSLDDATRLLHEAGLDDVRQHPVGADDDLADVVRQALAEEPDLLVVGGGDGTVSAAAGVVAGSGTTLGVLPLGTANDFARTLEVPFELEGAVRTLVEGKVVDVDLGRADGTAYLNVASMGLSVGVTEMLDPRLKKTVGSLAYPIAALRAFRDHTPFSAVLEFPEGDNERLELEDLLQVAVGNGRHYGGGNAVAPNASVDDHLLDVYAIVRGRLRDHLSIARFMRSGRMVEHEQVHHVTTRAVRITTDPAQAVNLDGEIATRTPTEFRVERNALRVVVPAGSRAADLDVEPG